MIDQLTTTVDNKLNISDLKPQHYAFGGRGDVWSDTAHIAQSGEPITMCGRPMLSSNWVRMSGVEHIGCPKCLAKYKASAMLEYGDESFAEIERMIASVL